MKNMYFSENKCSTCLSEDTEVLSVFTKSEENISYIDMLEECTSAEILRTDFFPTVICMNCIRDLKISCNFKKKCKESYQKLINIVNSYKTSVIGEIKNESLEPNIKICNSTGECVLPILYNNLDESNAVVKNCREEKIPLDEDEPLLNILHENVVYVETPIKSPIDEIKYTCEFCSKQFKCNSHFSKHLKSHKKCKKNFPQKEENIIIQFDSESDLNLSKKLFCPKCRKEYYSQSDLYKHITLHTEKSFECPECYKSFTRKESIKSHMRSHTNEKPYSCNFCSKKFKHNSHYNKHLKQHTDIEKYKEYLEKNKQKAKSRTVILKNKYQCEFCGKLFRAPTYLNRHIRSHTDARPYPCTSCGKAFNTKATLQIHTRIHTGEKPYRCSECSKEFYDQTNYTRHRKLHMEDKKYKCNICNQRFIWPSILKNHMKTHSGEKTSNVKVRKRNKNIPQLCSL